MSKTFNSKNSKYQKHSIRPDIRKTWGIMSPVTRIKGSNKIYTRKKFNFQATFID